MEPRTAEAQRAPLIGESKFTPYERHGLDNIIKSITKPGKKINYKERFWKVFSEWVRRSEGGKCFTCSTIKDWKEMDAGHFVNAGKSPPPLYFSEKNVHCQCTSCNRFKHGNLEVYARNLVRQYGANILEELEIMRNAGGKWNNWTYQIKIEEYKQKLKELKP